MARPKSHRTQLRTRRIVFRITDAEFLRLSYKAATLNMRINDLARTLTMSEAKPTSSKDTHHHDPALIRQLYCIGNNLNQLIKNAHIFGRISPQVKQLCQRIETLMDEAIEKEGI